MINLTVNPNVYVLGGKPEIDLIPTDQDGNFFTPSLSRLSIKQPDGVVVTFSGGDLVTASGYFYADYKPPMVGWYEYEGWVADSSGREIAQTNGFEVIDRVY